MMEGAAMITMLFYMTVKAEREDEWRELLGRLSRSTHGTGGIVQYHQPARSAIGRSARASRAASVAWL